MKIDNNYSNLKKYCITQGADLFGVADISKIKDEFLLSKELLDSVDKAICVGAGLSNGVLADIHNHPTRLYFHHYRTLNVFLDQLALKVARYIQKKGFKAIPIPASQIVDWEKQRAHLSHRKIGLLAGVGWIGRNNLLVSKELGSQFRMATVLTNMPLKLNQPTKDSCASCKLCISVCPAQAIKENPIDFDYQKCFQQLKEFQKQRLVDQYICGVCVKVCQRRNR